MKCKFKKYVINLLSSIYVLVLFMTISNHLVLGQNNNIQSKQKNQKNMKKIVNPPDSFEYADGSGNLYKVIEQKIHYEPVKPEFSSSGLYSGGKPASKQISEKEYNELMQDSFELMKNTEIHEKNRVKGSGLLRMQWGFQVLHVLLKYKAEEKDNFEKKMKDLLTKL